MQLEIRADGVAVGSTLAHLHRPDLQEAGIGKGRAMFRFAAPERARITVHGPNGAPLPLSDECRISLAG